MYYLIPFDIISKTLHLTFKLENSMYHKQFTLILSIMDMVSEINIP